MKFTIHNDEIWKYNSKYKYLFVWSYNWSYHRPTQLTLKVTLGSFRPKKLLETVETQPSPHFFSDIFLTIGQDKRSCHTTVKLYVVFFNDIQFQSNNVKIIGITSCKWYRCFSQFCFELLFSKKCEKCDNGLIQPQYCFWSYFPHSAKSIPTESQRSSLLCL